MPQGARCRAFPCGSTRRDGGCHPSARSPLIAFLRFQRAAMFRDRDAHSTRGRSYARTLLEPRRPPDTRSVARLIPAPLRTVRVCFTPATLLSFRLQGLDPPGDADAFPRPVLPCRCPAHSDADLGFEGFTPPDSRLDRRKRRPRRALLAFPPLRPSLPLPWTRLPGSSSHALPSAPAEAGTELRPRVSTSSGPGFTPTRHKDPRAAPAPVRFPTLSPSPTDRARDPRTPEPPSGRQPRLQVLPTPEGEDRACAQVAMKAFR